MTTSPFVVPAINLHMLHDMIFTGLIFELGGRQFISCTVRRAQVRMWTIIFKQLEPQLLKFFNQEFDSSKVKMDR